jgi:hypothetical protein
MTVAEMIEKLHQYPPDMEVQVTDGFQYKVYKGNFEFQMFEDVDGSTFVDIGVGGYDYD